MRRFGEPAGSPIGKEEEAGGEREEESALGDEHGEEEILPRPFGGRLEVLDLPTVFAAEEDEGGEAAAEEEGGEGEAAAPAPEGTAGQDGSGEANEDEAVRGRETGEEEEGVEEVGADGVAEGVAGQDEALGPEGDAGGEVIDEAEVEGEVAEIVRGEDEPAVVFLVDEPEKGAEAGEEEGGDDEPFGPRSGGGGRRGRGAYARR